MKKKIEIDDEIDLIEVLEICWHGKYKIIFSIVFFILLTYGFLQTKKPNDKYFEAITILKPISSFVEDKYDDFNYLVKSESKIIDLNLMSKRSTLMTLENFETDNREKNTQTSSVFMINKKLLMYLFIEKLEDGRIFENAIKKFKILNKEDYGSSQQYQEAINKLKSSILIKKISSNKIGKVDVDGVTSKYEPIFIFRKP